MSTCRVRNLGRRCLRLRQRLVLMPAVLPLCSFRTFDALVVESIKEKKSPGDSNGDNKIASSEGLR